VHILTDRFPPQVGGLESWTHDLATALWSAGLTPFVYVLGASAGEPRQSPPFEVVDVGQLRAPWEPPLLASRPEPIRLEQERSRLTFACTNAAVGKRTGQGADVVLSNFVTAAGFIAHLVADALDLPHVPVIAGSDFTRDFRGRVDRHTFREVCASAPVVVGRSVEHARALRRHFPITSHQIIETSVELPTRGWSKPTEEVIAVFSDGGFSFKKGTGVLMDAVSVLPSRGIPARLVICGSDHPGQEDYWRERRCRLEEQSGFTVHFPGYLTHDQIVEQFCAADIYASASLGEGSSAAQARALCLGVPVVSTACGVLADDPKASHVRLVPVGDADAFHEAVLALATDLHAGSLSVDHLAVDRFHRRFAPEREWSAWVSLLRDVASAHR
jgi:glycosyltransferase involved in cell wall biosynthesis